MSWADNLQDASFRGVAFEVERTSDSRSRTQAVYQPPYASSATVEDMGADPRKHSIRAYLLGDDYEIDRERLIAALDTAGAGELVHPIYNRLWVSITNYNVLHSLDMLDGCAIDIECIVAADPAIKPELFRRLTIPTATAADVVLEQPAARVAKLQQQLDYFNPQPLTLAQMIDRVRQGIRKATRFLNTATRTLDNLLSPPLWMGGLLSDVAGLARALTPELSFMAEWRSLGKRLDRLADMFDDDDPEPLRYVARHVRVAAVITAAQTVIQSESRTPRLTPPDLISVRNDVRQVILTAIAEERAAELAIRTEQAANPRLPPIQIDATAQIRGLKAIADQIQTQIQILLERRPPLIGYRVQLPTNPRLLAHRLYGDHRRATELLRLNPALVNPALMLAGYEVQTYAK